MKKLCKKCGKKKPIEDFYLVAQGKPYRRSLCIPCHNAASLEGFQSHPEWLKRIRDRRTQKRSELPFALDVTWRFGITVESALKIYHSQGGKCAICGTGPKRNRLALDHDHSNGKVRGFLCHQCNGDLAVIEDTDKVARMRAYLEKHGKTNA